MGLIVRRMAKVAKRDAILVETGQSFEVVAADRLRAPTEVAAAEGNQTANVAEAAE